MKEKLFLTITFAALTIVSVFSQSRALTFQEAEKQGIPFHKLDSLYKSAVHTDPALAVFKSPDQQAELLQAYVKLLQDLGAFLRANNFKWNTEARGANRIYMQPDGRIDYFLFHFPEGQLTPEKEQQFTQLLDSFIRNYRFAITAPEKFAQCSAVRYTDN
ncbi:hypothetical protein [Pontibacter populi]|uniref:Uncharacterized protein n=1 Tax=Pontibacter populi TaxID=890055 RepID=A0ABV1RRJ3_9BACT